MTQSANHEGFHPTLGQVRVVTHPRGRVNRVKAMHPHVTLGVPLGMLLAADESFQLGEVNNPARIPKKLQAHTRTLGLHKKLLKLLPNPLLCEMGEGIDHAPNKIHGSGVHAAIGAALASKQLHSPQSTERVLHKQLTIRGSENASRKVCSTTKRVQNLTRGKVERHSIDGEVTASCRFFDRHSGVKLGQQVLMTLSNVVISTGNIDINIKPIALRCRQLDDAELRPNKVRSLVGKHRGETVKGKPEYFDVPIFGLPTVDGINDGSADKSGRTARLLNARNKRLNDGWNPNHGWLLT